MDTKTLDSMTEHFIFLDDLRASGETNMFGARPYLMDEFELDKADAAKSLSAWMETFDESPAATRAAKALAKVK